MLTRHVLSKLILLKINFSWNSIFAIESKKISRIQLNNPGQYDLCPLIIRECLIYSEY